MPQGKYTDIINKLKPNAALVGDIVHLDGRVLGRHDGIVHYTIGQRRGIGVATGEPLMSSISTPAAAASSSAHARRWRHTASICAT